MIETRFTPEHGYLVESQRGGGGFIRIIRLLDDKQRTLLEAARGIGGRLSQNDAARLTRALVSAELLTQREGQLLLSAARTVRWRRLIRPTATDARSDLPMRCDGRCDSLRGTLSPLDTEKVPKKLFRITPSRSHSERGRAATARAAVFKSGKAGF